MERTYPKKKDPTLVFTLHFIAFSFFIAMLGYGLDAAEKLNAENTLSTLKLLETLSDTVYQSLSLFFFGFDSRISSKLALGILHAARLLCPLSLWSFALSLISNFFSHWWMQVRSLNRHIKIGNRTFGKESVAIYGNNTLAKQASEGTHFIQAGDYFLKNAKRHIILMDNDDDSLSFYKAHEAELSQDTTYIGLQQMSSFLMRSIPNVFYFNVYEEIARDYWKKNSIHTAMEADSQYSIVILGYCRDNLGYQLLKYGLMNNIFRKDQKIVYHVFCKPEETERGFEQMQTMLGDSIVWHTESWQRHLSVIMDANRILLCRTINPHILNQLLLTCTTQHIHYYDPDSASYPEKYAYENMKAFGCTASVLNENSILKCALHSDAVERHFQYTREYGRDKEKAAIEKAVSPEMLAAVKLELWNGLSGLLKNSNTATSDYYMINPVKSDLTKDGIEYRAELEHIRWCRFHFLCGWQHGDPANGERKDSQMRIHRDLVPWDVLPESEKEKDRQQVEMEIQKQYGSV